MATAAIAGYLVFLALAFFGRVALQLARTGSSGLNGISRRTGPAETIAGVLFVAAMAAGGTAPWLARHDVLEPIAALDTTPVHVAGVVLFAGGLAATLAAQIAMGSSWRVGVDPEERTELVTTGPFAVVRNPIFAAMLPATLGLVLMVPSALALAAIAGVWLSVQLQVRVVEEPHLRRVHGAAYAAYAARVGRFVPGIGHRRG